MATPAIKNMRRYGNPPFRVALLHGGPGANGEMAPVARQLSESCGILEPLQTADSLDGQVAELKRQLEGFAELPAVVAGYSWGAWLGFILAARHPALVRKLILIGSGPFEEQYVQQLHQTRMSRLSNDEKTEIEKIAAILNDPNAKNKQAVFTRFGALFGKTDSYDPITEQPEPIDLRSDIYRSVWPEAAELRKTGELLDLAANITCPVTAIHGDYDPHPAAGVEKPLAARLKNFHFILLDHCGHTPWIESRTRERFFEILRAEIKVQTG